MNSINLELSVVRCKNCLSLYILINKCGMCKKCFESHYEIITTSYQMYPIELLDIIQLTIKSKN